MPLTFGTQYFVCICLACMLMNYFERKHNVNCLPEYTIIHNLVSEEFEQTQRLIRSDDNKNLYIVLF